MVLSESGGDGPDHFEKWWGCDPTVPTVRYAYDHNDSINKIDRGDLRVLVKAI